MVIVAIRVPSIAGKIQHNGGKNMVFDRNTTLEVVREAGIPTKLGNGKEADIYFLVPDAHSYVAWKKDGAYVFARPQVEGDQYGKKYKVTSPEEVLTVLRARMNATPRPATPKPAPVTPVSPAPTQTQQEVEPVAWEEPQPSADDLIKQLEQELIVIQQKMAQAREEKLTVRVVMVNFEKVLKEEVEATVTRVLSRSAEFIAQ